MSGKALSDEKARVSFAAIVLLLRQMAHQLLQDGRADEARGLIDGIEAIRAKSKGNLEEEEQKFIDDVLYELQMMAVKGPPPKDSDAPAAKAPGAGADEESDGDGDDPDGESPTSGAEAPG